MAMMGYPYGYMSGGGWWGLALMLFFGALVIAGIVLVIVLVVRGSGTHRSGGPSQPSTHAQRDEALEIARRRFAAGEITSEQFDELKRTLGG